MILAIGRSPRQSSPALGAAYPHGHVIAADAIPEPTAIAGFSLAGAGLAYARHHRKKKIK